MWKNFYNSLELPLSHLFLSTVCHLLFIMSYFHNLSGGVFISCFTDAWTQALWEYIIYFKQQLVMVKMWNGVWFSALFITHPVHQRFIYYQNCLWHVIKEFDASFKWRKIFNCCSPESPRTWGPFPLDPLHSSSPWTQIKELTDFPQSGENFSLACGLPQSHPFLSSLCPWYIVLP